MPCLHYPLLKERIKKITLQQLSCSDLSSPTSANSKQQQEKRVPKKKSRRRNSHNLKQENKPSTKQSQLEARKQTDDQTITT
jgi:glutamate racemase